MEHPGRDAVLVLVRRRDDRAGDDPFASRSNATALVNVPPTSTPTRTVIARAASITQVVPAPAGAVGLPGLGAGLRRGGDAPPALRAPAVHRRADHEHPQRAEQVDARGADLREDRLTRRAVAGGLGEEDRQAGPAVQRVVADDVGRLQLVHRVAEERDRRGHEQQDREGQERLDREAAAELEDRAAHHGERDDAEPEAEQDPAAETLAEREQRLVEQHGLEALAVHRGEPDEHEARRGTERHRGPHPRLEELHPPLVLEARDQPERDPEEDHDGQDRGRGLHHLPSDRSELDDEVHCDDRRERGEHGEPDAPEDRSAELRGLGGLEVAEEHREQQHGFEALPEDDEERLAGHEQRRGEPGARELALGFVDDAAQLDDPVAHVVGAAVADRLADLGELRLGVERELRIGDAQRDLHELEVVEVALPATASALARPCPA